MFIDVSSLKTVRFTAAAAETLAKLVTDKIIVWVANGKNRHKYACA